MRIFIGSSQFTPKQFFTRRDGTGRAIITVVTLEEGGAVVFFPGTDRVEAMSLEDAREAWVAGQ